MQSLIHLACRAAPAALVATVAAAGLAPNGLQLRAVETLEVLECQPVIVEAQLRNRGDRSVRIAAPDALYNVTARFLAEPEALRATFLLSGGLIPEQPPAVLELGPGDTVQLRAWLDERYPAGLLSGAYRVRLQYRPAARYASWQTSPELDRLVVTSNEIALTVTPPLSEGDRTALAIYREEYAAYWGLPSGVRIRKQGGSPFSVCTPAELRNLADAKRAARLLVEADTAALRAVWAQLGPDGQAAARAVAVAREVTAPIVETLVAWLNEVILGPALADGLDLANTVVSESTRRILAAPAPLADSAPANRALLEDLLPGCFPPSLFRLAYADPPNAYSPLAMYMLADGYYRRRKDPLRALAWLDRLAMLAPDWTLRGRADLLRFEALLDLDRVDEAAAVADALQDGRHLALHMLAVRGRRAAAPPP